jgi:hypothetical protein
MKTQTLQVGEIQLGFQSPENIIEERVLEYVEKIRHGDNLPAIRVRFDGRNYYCEDGFHRLEAARRTGLKEIQACILKGTLPQMEANFQRYLKRLKRDLARHS